MKKLILFSILALFVSRSYADDYYWVGGSGSWSEITHWSSTSGGVPNKSIVPSTGDDVYFDANSGLIAGSVVTFPTSGHAVCRNMSWVGVTTAAIFRNNGSFQLQINGNLELSATVKYAMTTINFLNPTAGPNNVTYRTNGAVRLAANLYNNFIVNKPGGSLTLLDGMTANLGTSNLVLAEGTLNLSGQTHVFGSLSAGGATVRSVNISNSTITLTGTWETRGTNITLNATGSTVTADMFHSAGLTFAKVIAERNNPDMDISGNTFAELILNAEEANIGTQRIGANNTIARLEFKGGGRLAGAGNVIGELVLAPGKGYIFHGNNTINTSMLANTPDCDALGELRGIDANARLTFGPGATADIRNVFMTSLTAAGSIVPITVVGVDGGSNTGFNIQPRAAGNATLYWVGGGGEWNDKAHWSATSGGAGGACVPFMTDNVVFDANSGFTSASKTVILTSTSWCRDMTWTNVANSPIFSTNGYPMEIWGSVELDPTLTLQAVSTQYVRDFITIKGSEATTFTAKGCKLGNPLFNIDKTGPNGGVTLTDNIAFPACSLRVASGKLLMPGRTVNIAEFRSQTNTVRTIDFSNATITVDGWALDERNVTSLNNGAGSFITAKTYFTANGLTYPKVHCDAIQNTVNIYDNTTIGELVFTNTSPSTLLIALNGNNNIGTLDIRGGRVHIRGFNTINNLLLTPSRIYYFRGTQTITGLMRFNNPACNGLGEIRDFEGTGATLNFGPSSTRDFDNVYLQNITATGSGVPISVAGADAGGNTGFNITPSAAGPRYWVGGSGNWNESAHWSTTSGGPGGACVPTVANDVYFNANSFTAGSSTVTISEGNAYCRNMDWTGAAFSPVFSKASNNLYMEIWGNLTLNNAVTINAQLLPTGTTNSTFTSNGNALGNLDFLLTKSVGYSFRFMDNFSNPRTRIDIRGGGLDLSGRTITLDAISDGNQNGATSINITNTTVNAGAWEYQGGNKSLQAVGSIINTSGYFVADDAAYNKISTGATASSSISLLRISATEIIFTHPSAASEARIYSGNTIGKLEFKGKGYIAGPGNIIDTLIFSPGKQYVFYSGSNTIITKEWFGSGTPCNLTEITSSAGTPFTVTKTAGEVNFDYVRLRNITAAGITPFKALEHSEDLTGNTNWSIAPYNGSTPILGLGPDITLCANEFPYTLNTDGFFASPLASFLWTGGSTGKTLVVNGPGTYSVTVSYPDGCSRTDAITITRSDVVIAPITGTASVCVGNTTPLATTTPGGTWSTNAATIATVSTTGVVTGIAAGTATITYTFTNGDGCTGTQTRIVTVNALPVVNAITGTLTLFEGGTTALSNTTPGGLWSTGNPAVATVNGTGVVTGVSGGTADITYTVTNANGCTVARTVTVTVDGFSPAKRQLSITQTANGSEPTTNGAFSIHLPTGILAVEPITITYTVGGTATAPGDYTALSGTATIATGQNGITVPVAVQNDGVIESTETVIVTINPGTSANYTYTTGTGNATVQIADDDNVSANRILSVTRQGGANEPADAGTFTVALPTGVLAPEDITVSYTLGGTSTNGVDYELLPVTVVIPAGQNNVVIDVEAKDDKIIESIETIEITLTGGTTPTAGSFTVSATQGTTVMSQADDDSNISLKVISVTGNGDAGEPGTNSSFTISLPAGYTTYVPVTVTYVITGTATNGLDYTGPSTTVILPAGDNSVTVPVTVTNDDLIEPLETVTMDVRSGRGINSGGTTVITFFRSTTAGIATVNITDEDNTVANRTLSVTAQNAAEPATSGYFTVSLPSGKLASEDITVNYTISGDATPGSDYTAINATVKILAGRNNVQVPLNVMDDPIIESIERVTFSITNGTSTNFTYTASATNGSVDAEIADNDFAGNSQVVLLTKVSDAMEGGADGRYRLSFPPGVTSSEEVRVNFTIAGTAGNPLPNTDYALNGASAGLIVIPPNTNEVFVDVDALTDAVVEGPETVVLTITQALSDSHTYTIAPSSNSATVNIIDNTATTFSQLHVTAGTAASEPLVGATFTVGLPPGVTASFPITVAYKLTGLATPGTDFQMGTIVIPAGDNSVSVVMSTLDDKIIEGQEDVVFEILSGSGVDGGTPYYFTPDAGANAITIPITDDDVLTARVLKVTPGADGAEPGTNGSFTISLPVDYTSDEDITLMYNMSGTATATGDYTLSTVILPKFQNSVTIPVLVTDDPIIEGTETVILTLNTPNAGTDGNFFDYTRDATDFEATVNIADDDNTPVNSIVKVVKISDGVEGGSTVGFNFELPAGIVPSALITIDYTIAGTAANSTDYNGATAGDFSGTATIPAGSLTGTAIVANVVNDLIIEGTETVTVTITGLSSPGFTYTIDPVEGTATADILDNDDLAANRVLSVEKTTDAQETSTNGRFTISLPGGAVAANDIAVNYTVSGTGTAGTDYTDIGTSVVIPAGQTSVTVDVPVIDDQLIETTETVVLTIIDGDAAGMAFTASTTDNEATVDILDNDNVAGNLIVSVPATADASEPGTNGTFTVSLPAGYTATEDITVTYTTGGTATAGADYSTLGSTVVIPAGQTSVQVTVAVTDDDIIESAETVELTITAASSTSFTLLPSTTNGSGTVLINDDENSSPANRTLTITKGTDASEPATNGSFTISLPAGISAAENVTVNYTVDGTATAGADYVALSGIAVISAGQNSVSVPVTISDDQLIEVTETVRATITSAGSASFTFTASGNATVDITDDESTLPANFTVTIAKGADAAEPGTNGNLIISLPIGIAVSEDVTVNYTVSGTAAVGSDYTALSGSVIIPAGQNSVSVPVMVADDNIIETTETVITTLAGGSSTSFTFTGTGNETVNITDNDNTPVNIALSITKLNDASEPGTAGRVNIELLAGITTTEDITVTYTIAGTATADVDYAALTGTAIIPAGQSSVMVPVSVTDDQVIEQLETVMLTLTGGTSASFAFTGSGNVTVNISDDDNTPANLVLNVISNGTAAEPNVPGSFTISLPAGITATEDITVSYAAGGTAAGGDDYSLLSGLVVIPAGDNSVDVPVAVVDDQLIEGTETVTLEVTGGTATGLGFAPGPDKTASLDITDDELDPAILVLSIARGTDGAEPGTNGSFTISLPSGVLSAEDITVNYTVSGTAASGADYTALSGTVTIPAGDNSVTVPVTVVNDDIIEVTETVIATLTGGSSTNFTFTAAGNATVNITDDESNVPANLALTVTKGSDASEPATNGSFVISLPGTTVSSEDVMVNYTIAGTATSGADYTALSGTVTIPAGDHSVTIPMTVSNDDIIEATETVILTLNGGSSTSFTFTGTGNATVNITDEDNVPANLALTVTKGVDASEPATNGSFVISLPGTTVSSEDVTVNYTITGTAAAGADYNALTGTVIIPAGDNSVTVPVTVSNDDIIETTETVILTLSGGSSTSFTFTGTGNATVNITDEENIPANLLLNVANNGDGAEPSTNGGFTISLPGALTAATDITVNYTITGTATAVTDYTALSGTVTIPAGDNSVSVPVAVNDDQLVEGNETVILTITNGTATGLTFAPGAGSPATVNIADNDASLEVVVSAGTPAPAEPATPGAFNISLAGGRTPAADVTVTYTISGSATADADYTALTGTAVIPAGSNSVSVPVTVLDDNFVELGETVIITLSGATSSGTTCTIGTANNATVTIADDDANTLELEVTATQPNAAEPAANGAFTFSIAGGKRTTEAVTVHYAVGGSAIADADYQAITGVITIPAGQNSVTVPVTVIDDIIVEDPEFVQLNINGGQSASFTWTAVAAQHAVVTISSNDLPIGDLTITKEIVRPLSGPYRIGQEITYRITVRNIGNGPATGVAVKDTLPVQLGLPSGTVTSTGQVNVVEADKVVVWTIGEMTPNASVQLEIRCRITEGGELVAIGEVESVTTDPDLTNNKAEIRLQIDGQDLNFPNVFTPNGDGKNEKFVIGGIEKYPGAKLQVFNRWGGQVYRSNDYRNDWNGSGLLESTYYYILEVKKPDGIKTYKGWIVIVR
ncbi:Calx-beta domain-containing protein [Chitinophaga barathri]|uniref:DUF11 domain-containing protein n=1 Tax=Chitinophaga barathri TaxID=1647451 RepID=A0A3N4M7V7_9BACT|nr:Calx-beta domain-containing protein [Chitinophaga barathri]RPD39634.1 DUF11 domain-containing protein [Chitinophaga barathri]